MRAHSTSTSAGYTGQEVAVIRITELPLPLDYTPEALRQAIVKRLKIRDAELLEFTLFKRSYDARKKNTGILFICIVDVKVADEAAVLKRFAQRSPDRRRARHHAITRSRKAPAALSERPLVIGFGPGGLFAALLLAQMGFKPIVLERGRDVRRRTQDTWALWRKNDADARIQRAIRRGRGGPVLRRQALQPDQGSEVLRPQGDARVRARRRAAGDPLRQQAAHRHLPPHRHRREDARGDHRARRRGALRKQGHRSC